MRLWKESPLLSSSRLRTRLSSARLASALSTVRSRTAPFTSHVSSVAHSRKKAVAYLGTAAVIASGAGAFGAAAASGQAASAPPALHTTASGPVATTTASAPATMSELASAVPWLSPDSLSTPVSLPSADHAAAVADGAGTQAAQPATVVSAAPAQATPVAATAAPVAASAAPVAASAAPVAAAAPAAPAQPAPAPAPARPSLNTWPGIEDAAANQGANSPVAVMYNPLPVGVGAPQSQLPMNQEQWGNATTIVRQALAKGMGLRSAVIAVATAMQESKLININYGTYDSLGLFQQRPSAGWGSAAQVTDPAYASDAFLDALHNYQVGNPGWATQPVWMAAQGVQNSAFPQAYEQWEVQAAQVVMGVAHNLL